MCRLVWYCPKCMTQMQDHFWVFYCPKCKLAFPFAEETTVFDNRIGSGVDPGWIDG